MQLRIIIISPAGAGLRAECEKQIPAGIFPSGIFPWTAAALQEPEPWCPGYFKVRKSGALWWLVSLREAKGIAATWAQAPGHAGTADRSMVYVCR